MFRPTLAHLHPLGYITVHLHPSIGQLGNAARGNDVVVVESGVRSILSSIRLAVRYIVCSSDFILRQGMEDGHARAAWSRVSDLATTITRVRKPSAVMCPGRCVVGRWVEEWISDPQPRRRQCFTSSTTSSGLFVSAMTALQLLPSSQGPRGLGGQVGKDSSGIASFFSFGHIYWHRAGVRLDPGPLAA